ncbi:CvpA family protein [Nitrincola iocasae]|jgi:membrane protein required for colicin V production|uniref:CvpA family protein n=1 Tax=Nitrincola iocasae TaxID=2614693 RepID=A0A5J6LEF4_9GAMM|nr:CvpA family protein [Nitrincola iocasae]QEW06980.1 CvpA family protein [Nitrincola iocasae]
MNWADWVILAIVLISSVMSLRRGFIREAVSLITWVAAFIVGRLFYQVLAEIIAGYFDAAPSVHQLVAFLILFIATLIVGNLIGSLISSLVKITGLSATDRVLGVGFGALRGGLVVVIMLVLLKMTPATQDPWWNDSVLIPHFLVMETWSRDMARDVGQMIWSAGS